MARPARVVLALTSSALLVAATMVASGCQNRSRGGGDGSPAVAGADLSIASEGPDLAMGCATSVYSAMQAPAAMLVVLDRSASMAENNKYNDAAQAIVSALDQDVFDSMYVGLYAAPSGTVAGPACIFGLSVACASPPFPQIDLTLAGSHKSSDPTGVRHSIKAWLSNNSPDNGVGDATPMYAALQSAIPSLTNLALGGKRILMIITDGSWDCTQLSNRPGYADCNGCDHEWEKPQSVISLVGAAETDPTHPVETFVVGVPGADTYDASGCNDPPYHMRAALSAIAAAGSPANVPPGCATTFSDGSPDPAVACHFDMTKGNWSAQALAQAISQIRGQVLGCTYDLPAPPDGGVIDPTEVNVTETIGGADTTLKKRSDPTDTCAATGCWDYDANGKVILVGKACDDVKGKPDVQVKIVVGCPTIIG